MSDLKTALRQRRSYYAIAGGSPVGDRDIVELLEFAVLHSPSAFNSQSGRIVLLLGQEHRRLWEIVREALRRIVPAAAFAPTDAKITSFAAGHGTVLFYEDRAVVEALQAEFPLYSADFPVYSDNATGMLQYVVWVLLRDAGLGASLQHYGNLIEAEVAAAWGLNRTWRLTAQMPFGIPESEPAAKEQQPLAARIRVFS
ncbi:MAG: nitroreductase family protein [Planctomycetes bacterium]|nr:nitroreductase family protein [Planctomycetota bacterium]